MVSKIKVGILDIHEGYDESNWYVDTFTYSKIRDNISEYYSEIEIEHFNDFANIIYNKLKPEEHTVLNITDLVYTKNYVIQGIYNVCQDLKHPSFNKLASQLTKNINVQGCMILIKRDITTDKLKFINFDISELIDMIKDTFVHNSLLIKPDNSIINYPYINDVLEAKIEEYTFKNIRYYEHKFLDYILTFFCDISAPRTDDNLNRFASTVYSKKIYGDVYITLTTTREDFVQNLNITEDVFKQIYHIYATDSSNIDFKKYAVKPTPTTQELDNNCFPAITYYPNFFYVINREYQETRDKTICVDINTFNETLNDLV